MGIGDCGIYRKQVGVDMKHKPSGNLDFQDEVKNAEFKKFTGADYFDLAAIVLSINSDNTVNIVAFGDPVRDGYEQEIVRSVTVSTTPSIGSFTPAGINLPPVTPVTNEVTS
jgi:hypothetical protein